MWKDGVGRGGSSRGNSSSGYLHCFSCSPEHTVNVMKILSAYIKIISLRVSGHCKQIFEMIYRRMFTQMVQRKEL